MKKQITGSIILLYVLLLSCKTAPKTANMVQNETGHIPLTPGGFAYIFADLKTARPILNNQNFVNMNDKQMRQMLDRTESVVAAVYFSSESQSQPAYQLVAWGNYPAGTVKMALGANKDWEKLRSRVSGSEFWYAKKNGLSVAVSPKQANVSAAQGDTPADPFSGQETTVPDGFGEFRRGAALSCWIDNPGPLISQKLREMEIPLEFPAEQLFISLFPVPEQPDGNGEQWYQAHFCMETNSAAQARALTTLFVIARGFLPSRELSLPNAADGNTAADRRFAAIAALFFANPPVQDGKYLNITTNALSAGEIALLFKMFLP